MYRGALDTSAGDRACLPAAGGRHRNGAGRAYPRRLAAGFEGAASCAVALDRTGRRGTLPAVHGDARHTSCGAACGCERGSAAGPASHGIPAAGKRDELAFPAVQPSTASTGIKKTLNQSRSRMSLEVIFRAFRWRGCRLSPRVVKRNDREISSSAQRGFPCSVSRRFDLITASSRACSSLRDPKLIEII